MMAVVIVAFLMLSPMAFSQEPATGEAESVPFEVCERADSWTRPSVNEQRAAWNFPRYGWSEEEGKTSYEWNHFFFLYYGNAGFAFDVRNLTGLWVARDVERLCEDDEHQQEIADRQIVGVWLLLHQAKRMEREGTIYTLTVEPSAQGFQRIDFARPEGPPKNLTLIFKDPDGEEIDRLVEGVTPWTNDLEQRQTPRSPVPWR